MAIVIGGQSKRIGLALSGGGFRAAAFHLGVMQALRNLKLLDKIDLLSCVSGGSIAGAVLAANWSDKDAALAKLETYLRTRSIAVASFVGGLIDPFESRIEKLTESYDAHLFHGLKLGDLKTGPRLYLNATNLTTGNMFFFVTGENKDVVMGDHELKTADASAFPLCQAVAASSAFPPVFPPMPLHAKTYPPGEPYDYVTLSDGGVYDNMGINPMMLDRNALDYVIISDAARPLERLQDPVDSGSMVLRAALDIMMNQIRGLQFDRVRYHHLANKGPKPMWFSIDSTEGEAQAGDADLASAVGTNLKSLSNGEMSVLLRHAGALLKARLTAHAPELLSP